MGWVSHKIWFAAPLLLVILLLLFQRFGPYSLVLWSLLLVSIGIGDATGNFLKHQLQKPRPCQMVELNVHTVESPFHHACSGSPNGMPSNHALNFFLLATFLGVLLQSWRWFLVFAVLASSVGISRIYLGLHFPTQVLAGAALGVVMGWCLATIVHQIRPIKNLLGSARKNRVKV